MRQLRSVLVVVAPRLAGALAGAVPGAESAVPARSQCRQTALVTNRGSDTVSLIDVRTRTKTPDDTTVGAGPLGVAVTPDGKTAFVTNGPSGTVSTIDVKTRTKHPHRHRGRPGFRWGEGHAGRQDRLRCQQGQRHGLDDRLEDQDQGPRRRHGRPVLHRGGVYAVSLTGTNTRPDLRRRLVQTCAGKVRIRNSSGKHSGAVFRAPGSSESAD
jgi:YVTN family beta-propeller protein